MGRDLDKEVAALQARVLSKDAEFAKERQSWKRREAELLRTIKDLKCRNNTTKQT